MITDADKAIVEVKEALNSALRNLSGIVVTRDINGHNEFTDVYLVNLKTAINKLMEARDLLI